MQSLNVFSVIEYSDNGQSFLGHYTSLLPKEQVTLTHVRKDFPSADDFWFSGIHESNSKKEALEEEALSK